MRLSPAQPDHNPNLGHCLYGLDADLIMTMMTTTRYPYSSFGRQDAEEDWEDESSEEEEEGAEALQRVLRKYASARIDY